MFPKTKSWIGPATVILSTSYKRKKSQSHQREHSPSTEGLGRRCQHRLSREIQLPGARYHDVDVGSLSLCNDDFVHDNLDNL